MMDEGEVLEARRERARSHSLRRSILALETQGKSLDPEDLRRELQAHPATALIEYHLSVLRQVNLLPPAVHQ